MPPSLGTRWHELSLGNVRIADAPAMLSKRDTEKVGQFSAIEVADSFQKIRKADPMPPMPRLLSATDIGSIAEQVELRCWRRWRGDVGNTASLSR